MTFRHLLSWKPLFFDGLLPPLRRLGPARCDAALRALGRGLAAWPPRGRELAEAIERTGEALGAGWDAGATRGDVAANVPRFLARDYPLQGATDAEVFSRFEVRGREHLDAALATGRGVLLLGSHLGDYMGLVHWLHRRRVGFRLFVQRPKHVSRELLRRFEDDEGPHPQSGLFVRRRMPPSEAAAHLLRAYSALRDGVALYLCGDIPWASRGARPGRFLGRDRTFLSVWADLAALTGAPVLPMFCTRLPGGRSSLTIDAPWGVPPGGEDAAVSRFLARLESEIVAHPADAVAYLTWPCYRTAGEGAGSAAPFGDRRGARCLPIPALSAAGAARGGGR
jgi:phosphatidylinositol dimannoside acyltransferase